VNDLYETGRSLTEKGAVLGQDMTKECCFAKLSYLIGKVTPSQPLISDVEIFNSEDKENDADQYERGAH
jgi:L-asparaginase/Glu-tRNA(Gln) amidotransferase subunit D